MLQSLYKEMQEYNPFFRQLKTVMEEAARDNELDYHIVLSDVAPSSALGPRTYNAPTAIEVGGLVIGQPGESAPRQVTIRSRSAAPPHHLQFINSKESSYDPLSYTLLHMRGDPGWRLRMHSHMLIGDAWQENPSKVVSALDYYRYRAHPRDKKWIFDDSSTFDIDKDILFHGALLMHQYFVDQY